MATEFVNICNELFEFFPGRATRATADRWARRLVQDDYTISELRKGLDYTVHNCERLPSYSEFTTIIRNNSPRPDPQEEEDERAAKSAAAMRQRTQLMLDAYLGKYDQATLERSVRQWWVGVYGGNPADWGMSLRLFLPIFFEDLRSAKGDMDRCIEIGKNRANGNR